MSWKHGHGGHHGRHGGEHHGGGRHGHRQRPCFGEGPPPPGQFGPESPMRHHGWHRHRHHKEGWGHPPPPPPPGWQPDNTGYSWDYGFNPPPVVDVKIQDKPIQNDQIKPVQAPQNQPIVDVEVGSGQKKKEVNPREPPSYIVCPIAQTVMVSPVLLKSCGHTFDQKSIKDWLKKSGNCPICKAESNETDIIKNFSLIEAIDRFNSNA